MLENGFTVYGKSNCAGCDQAKALLEAKGLGYEYVDVMRSASAQTMFRENGYRSVPQIFKDGKHIESLEALKTVLEKM